MIRWLNEFDDVVAVIGGQKIVAGICDVGPSTISEWRSKRGQFDAKCEDAINNELYGKWECMASPRLFHRVNGSPPRPVRGKLPRWTEAVRRRTLDRHKGAKR